MYNTFLMQVLNRVEHLTDDISCDALSETLLLNDSVEKFTASAVLHYDMYVSTINVGLVELDNVRVIYSLHNCKLLFQKSDILGDVLSQDRLDCKDTVWVSLETSCSNCAEVTTSYHLYKVVDCAHIGCGERLRNVLKYAIVRACLHHRLLY